MPIGAVRMAKPDGQRPMVRRDRVGKRRASNSALRLRRREKRRYGRAYRCGAVGEARPAAIEVEGKAGRARRNGGRGEDE